MQQTLKHVFGFDHLRSGQEQVINTILSGQSAAAIFPTGSGKSLCYQLPALELPHLTLVISPLLALMKDQLAFLHSKGIAAASIDSSQDRQTIQKIMQSARNGRLKILMISVERLKNERFRQFIAHVPISLLVIDEAHCISEWGHNFRPDYLKLPIYQKQLNIPQVLLLTATATPQVVADMQQKFSIDNKNIVITGFYRSNLDLTVQPCSNEQKFPALLRHLLSSPLEPTIIYVTLQQSAEQLATLLQQEGIDAKAYHAGLKPHAREKLQQSFMNNDINCIVATIAFGMGVDKANIRRVIHFDLPKSIENYAQEIGRAGRDNQSSQCLLLANKNGLHVLENFVFGDTPDRLSIHHVIEQIYQQPTEFWEVKLFRLSQESNIRQLPLKTLLVYLEMANIIEPKYTYFSEYRFKFIESKQAIIERFQDERRQFVHALFASATQAKVWYQMDFQVLYEQYGEERQRAITALDYFHQHGWIELESKQQIEVYHINDRTQPIEQLSHHLHQLFKQKEDNEIARLHQLLNFFESDLCLSHHLANYFGDHNAPTHCGHCSVCRGQRAQLPQLPKQALDDAQIQQWLRPFLLASNKTPASIESQARYLCGITTPLNTQLKANKMDGFGKLEEVPFKEVCLAIQKSSVV